MEPIASSGGRFRMGAVRSPETLAATLNSRIIGQPEAVDAVVRALTIAGAGLRDPHRPIASLLLVGPTGVGKTELARQLAAEVTGSADSLCRVDMNALAQEHYAASLAGAPPGYSGAKEGLTLFDRNLIEGNHSRPGFVLLDEVEKAHTSVLRALLQILDSGVLRLAAGNETVDFRNCVVLLTSNLGSAEVAEIHRKQRTPSTGRRLAAVLPRRATARIFGEPALDARAAVTDAVEAFFDPELYNRFDEVVQFTALTRVSAEQIVDLELSALRTRLAEQGVRWQPTAAVRTLMLEEGFDPTYGARNLRRILRLRLHAPIASAIAHIAPDQPVTVSATVSGGQVIVDLFPDELSPTF